MTNIPYTPIELRIATAGSDLEATLEAAQFGRVIRPDEPETEHEVETMTAFVEAFEAAVEQWEVAGGDDRALTLARLGAQLETLEQQGLHVHAGTGSVDLARREAPPAPMPVAVLTISRSSLPTTTILLPNDLEVTTEEVTTH